jgi:hypothetical protein
MSESTSAPVDEQAVRRDVLLALEYAYDQDDWVCPLSEALEGLTAQEALWMADLYPRCIWEIVLHVSVWNENIVERMAQRLRGDMC